MALYRESIIARVDCDPPALVWSGLGNLLLPADAVLTEPAIALGGGELINVPDFQQLIGGTAERLELTFSGVDAETIRLAIEDAPSVRGARVDIGTIQFDGDWQILAVEWENVFEARSLTVSRPQRSGDSIIRTITLAIVQGATTRSRAKLAFFTDADQRRRSADDAIFSHVAGINGGTSRRFGPSDA
jgi:hypothetical protein